MNSQHWEKLRKNYRDIVESVEPLDVMPYLCEKSVLTFEERNQITGSGCTSELQMQELLTRLRSKKEEVHAFQHFVDALKTKDPYHDLAARICDTVSEADPSVRSRGEE
ncbi:uncharacterized protein LOC101861744 [Aplysia californica]|uniref:Uncharacterized protein LOC101861744 n=1 Tax=Aplysia californica TaxID=6500 RepID=A0ABM1A3J7_APLCA|nr:uncharacterized protein LOC101861744 [Aplysia californica]